MLKRVLRTKERWLIAALAVLIILAIVIYAINYINYRHTYEEQAVMAENHLEAGNYEQAIESYIKALSMKNSDLEILSLGLAKAYIGINDFDKALEVLRSCYQKTQSVKAKEKIEEATIQKKEYEYIQTIGRADAYFNNAEYEKAISEYEKAKLIKSKEAASYKKIAEAYIALENYAAAEEEVLRGLALTESDELKVIRDKVDTYLLKARYDQTINAAAEYIYQENYPDGISKYHEAIAIMPSEEEAYVRLAQVYISLGEYENAVDLINSALKRVSGSALNETLSKAEALMEEEEERNETLKELYSALHSRDTDKLLDIMGSSLFIDKLAVDTPVYYSPFGDTALEDYGMIIYDDENIYVGALTDNGMKNGMGIQFQVIDNIIEQGWYYYLGEWNHDIPSGWGKTAESMKKTAEGKTQIRLTITEGTYENGLEAGNMRKYFYIDDEEVGSISYTATAGKPDPLRDEEGQPITNEEQRSYCIAKLFQDKKFTGEYYYVPYNTVWGIRVYK